MHSFSSRLRKIVSKKRTIRQSFFIAIIMLVIIPLALFFLISLIYMREQHKERNLAYLQTEFERKEVLLINEIERLYTNAFSIVNSSKFREVITEMEETKTTIDMLKAFQKFSNNYSEFLNYRVQLYTNDFSIRSNTYSSENAIINKEAVEKEIWYHEIGLCDMPVCLFVKDDNGKKSFSILYKIMSSYDYTQEFGVLNITSNYPDLDTILFSGEDVFNEFSLLIDENNKIVYSSINNVPSEMLDSLSKYDSNLTKSIIEDSGFFVFCTNINNRSLKYIYAIPINRVYDPIYNMVNLWILFFLIIIVTVIILSIFISRIIDEPIRNLNEEIDNNVLKEIDEGRYSEELKLIVNAYNRAVRRIRRLINKINEDWKSKADVELELLKIQIHPHFLYNSLNALQWDARKNGYDGVADEIGELSSYLKTTIEPKGNFIDFKTELEHVRLYTRIQNLRHGNIIDLNIDVPDSFMDNQIIRSSLQPLVENCIKHGILMTDAECGSIIITARKSNEDIEIIVSDDGMGVDGTIVKSINSELADGVRDEFCGVGMYCVNTKLRLLFGIEYHLVFESTVNKGSKVTFRIPIIKKGDEVV